MTTDNVTQAIARSISHDEVVRLRAADDAERAELHEALSEAADNWGADEYWGEVDGQPWRVHVV